MFFKINKRILMNFLEDKFRAKFRIIKPCKNILPVYQSMKFAALRLLNWDREISYGSCI